MFFRYMVGLMRAIVVGFWVMGCGLIASEPNALQYLSSEIKEQIISHMEYSKNFSGCRLVNKEFYSLCSPLQEYKKIKKSSLMALNVSQSVAVLGKLVKQVNVIGNSTFSQLPNLMTLYSNDLYNRLKINKKTKEDFFNEIIIKDQALMPKLSLFSFKEDLVNYFLSDYVPNNLTDIAINSDKGEKILAMFDYEEIEKNINGLRFCGYIGLVQAKRGSLPSVESPLIMGITNCKNLVDKLLSLNNLDVNTQAEDGNTLLHLMIYRRDLRLLDQVMELKKTLNVFIKNKEDKNLIDIFFEQYSAIKKFLAPILSNSDSKELDGKNEELAKKKESNLEKEKKVISFDNNMDQLLKNQEPCELQVNQVLLSNKGDCNEEKQRKEVSSLKECLESIKKKLEKKKQELKLANDAKVTRKLFLSDFNTKQESLKAELETAKKNLAEQAESALVNKEEKEKIEHLNLKEVSKKVFFKKMLCVSAVLNVSLFGFLLYNYFLHYASA